MARIVLAHGILGFGSVLPMQPINYFNGIKSLYEGMGHQVRCPTVSALGSLDARSTELATQVLTYWPDDGQRIFLLAHSMGGLDCRRMLALQPEIARRVGRLITIATPHYGSPVANAVLQPGFFGLPNPIQLLSGTFVHDAGALDDLTTRGRLQDVDVTGVDYRCVGCDAGPSPSSFIFSQTALVGNFGGAPNDGVVGLASSSKTTDPATLLERWDVDHGGAIGWPTASVDELKQAAKNPPQPHLDRYGGLLATLLMS